MNNNTELAPQKKRKTNWGKLYCKGRSWYGFVHVIQKHTRLKWDAYQEFLWSLPCWVGRAGHGPAALAPGTCPPAWKAGSRFRADRPHQGLGLGKNRKSLMEMGAGWTRTRVWEGGKLLAWEKICKDIMTAFYPKKELLTLFAQERCKLLWIEIGNDLGIWLQK